MNYSRRAGTVLNGFPSRAGLMQILTFVILLSLSAAGTADAVIRYVKGNASGTNTGSSWTNAYTSLQSALGAAVSGDQIWVAAGTYKPTTGTSRTATFQLKNGVAIYGGFAGTETLLSQRDGSLNNTILSGDIGTAGNNADNSYHVVTGSGTNNTAVLDGFTITGGNATAAAPDDRGGGITNYSGSPSGAGGSPTIRNVTFTANSATYGGGVYNNLCSPVITSVTFSENSATYGGGICNNSSNPLITNTTFNANAATSNGGGIFNSGSNPAITNATFSGNSAVTSGGGIYNQSASSPVIKNSIFWGNTAPAGPQIYNASSTPTVSYSIVAGGCPTGSTCSGVLTADPQLGEAGSYGGFTQTLPLSPSSPAINTGDDASCLATDQRGITRPQLSHCDMGAYEFSLPVIYVRTAGLTSGVCESWTNACDLQYALGLASSGMQIWVAAGTYKPTTGTSRTATFQLKNGVAIYGGFAGTETLLSQRDGSLNNTILSGDIGTVGNNADNSYHVVTGSGMDNTAVLDGFTITGGNANAAAPNDRGGGITNYTPSVACGSPTIRNVTFTTNSATYGGGVYNNLCSPVITSVTFSGNSATYGGGIYNNNSNPAITNVTFSGNSAATYGGGIFNSGSNPAITNATFSGNSAVTSGGGIHNQSSSSPAIKNSIFWGNTAPAGPQIYNTSSTPTVSYSIVAGGCPTGSTCSGVLAADPLLSALGSYGGFTKTIRFVTGSPAIDSGDDAVCPATDQRGVTRPKGFHCDMGAYEYALETSPVYVKATGPSSGTCESWLNACDLAYALNTAASGIEIWAAGGTYRPILKTDPADPRTATFQLKNGVAVYGGFAGTETLLSQRDGSLTILSGDIGTAGNNADNSYHVVTGSGTDTTAILDGFTITGGNANAAAPHERGGGIYNNVGSPIIRNITLSSNSSTYGGGMYNNASSPVLSNVTFDGNTATSGGGIFNNSTDGTIANVTFSANAATANGGAIYNHASSPAMTNVTFSGNSGATNGGGIYNAASSNPAIKNSIFWGNTAPVGPQIYNTSSTPAVSYSIVQGGCPTGSTCSGVLVTDPLLSAPGSYGGLTKTIRLLPGSPAIDSGTDAACPATDQRGVTRPKGFHCDMGAYEFELETTPVYVKGTGLNSGACDSWANACGLSYALTMASSDIQIWVAAGTYKPLLKTDPADPRSATFQLKNSVALYGGFAGTETLLSQRDGSVNITILSGDIGTAGSNTDNSYHVVTGSGTDTTAILDGFTITGGNANAAVPNERGGGIYNNSGSPTIRNVTFSSNASTYGGGMYNNGSPAIANATFTANSASYGGGIYNESSNSQMTNVTFGGNSAGTSGGAVFNYNSSPAMTNVTVSGNSAGASGGGIYNETSSNPAIRNSILWGNTAPSGPQIYNTSSTPAVSYSIVQGGCPTGSTCASLLSTDPLLNALGDYGGFTQTLALSPGSPAIDAANDASCSATDQRGVGRPQGVHCDMGAFEFITTSFHVTVAGLTSGACGSPANACDLQYALGLASPGAQIWVAAGTYKPTAGTDRAASFQLKNGVALYGGFSGTETDLSQRNIISNVTILSGNIGTPGSNADNSYHVVTASNTDNTAVLDGFTITGGNANAAAPHERGGGIYNDNGNPTITNVIISSNAATYGGGMYNNAGSPALTNVTFSSNAATGSNGGSGQSSSGTAGSGFGGGIYNNTGSPVITDVTFSSNTATGGKGATGNGTSDNYGGHGGHGKGGGMYNASGAPALTNVTFSGNRATGGTGDAGNYIGGNGGSGMGGGMYNASGGPALANVTFSGNTATGGRAGGNNTGSNYAGGTSGSGMGGGMYNASGGPTLTNSNFSANVATGGTGGSGGSGTSSGTGGAAMGGGFYNSGSSPVLSSITFSSNTALGGTGGVGVAGGAGGPGNGGGVYNTGSPALTNTTFSGNAATGGTGGYGGFAGGTGGAGQGSGMYNNGGSPVLTNITFSSNAANGGTGGQGGLGNGSPGSGSGGGITNAAGTLTVTNSIVAASTSGGNCSGTIANGGNNIDDGTTCRWGSVNGSMSSVNPLLDPSGLQSNGGPTKTLALLPGSPAINAGSDAVCTASPVNNLDQRGISRTQGSHCDIGAYESRDYLLAITSGNNQSAVVNTTFASNVSLSVTSPFGEPVNGGKVTFSGPPAGAGINPATSVAGISGGSASLTPVANGTTGGPYQVVATASGASPVSCNLTNLPKSDQTISFGTLSDRTANITSFTVSATATSNLTVSFSSLTSTICTVTGTAVTLTHVTGLCTIRASQDGNAYYNPAANADRSFTVTAAALDHITLTPSSSSITAGGSQSYTAQGFDIYNNSRGNITAGFTITPDGSCTGSSCTATIAGSHTVTVTSGGKTASASLQVNAGALDHITIAPSSATITAGGSQIYTAQAFDAYNNSRGAVTATYTVSPNGSCSGNACTAIVSGSHTVTGSYSGKTATASLQVNPGSATKLVFTTQPGSATAGAVFGAQPVVRTQDAYGNYTPPSGAVTATVTLVSGSGPLQGTLTGNIGTGGATPGTVTFTNLRINVSGPKQLRVSATGLTAATSNTFTVSPGATATYTIAAPGTVSPGTPFTVTMTSKDNYGNTTTSHSGTALISSSDPQAVLPPGATLTNGSGSFSATLKTAGTQSVTATYSMNALIAGTANITVSATALHHLAISPASASITAGGSQGLSVEGFDEYNNSLGDFTESTVFSVSPDGSCSGNICTATAAGPHTVTGDNGGKTATASLQVEPGPAVAFSVSAPSSVIAGSTFDLTVTARDVYDNTVQGYAGTIELSATDPEATLPPEYAFKPEDSGSKTFAAGATLAASGAQTVTAADKAVASITGTSGSIDVVAGPVTRLLVAAPAVAAAGEAISVAVTAQDSFGNTVTGYAGTVRFTSTDMQAVLPGDYAFAAEDLGTKPFTVTVKTSSIQTITATDEAAQAIFGTSGSIAVTPGQLDHVSLAPPDASISAGESQSYTAEAFDQFNNSLGDVTGSAAFTIAPDGSCNGSSCTATAAGPHTVTGSYNEITATASLLTTAGAVDHIAVAPPDATISAGESQSYTAEAFDQYHNSLGDVTGAATFTITPDGSCTGSLCSASIAGLHTVTATAGGRSADASLQVNAGAVSSLLVSAPGNVIGGQAFDITVTAKDAVGNTLTGYAGTVQFTSPDTQAVLPADTALINGTGTFSVTLKTAGSQSVTATEAAGPASGSAEILVSLLTVTGSEVTTGGSLLCTPASLLYGDGFSCDVCPAKGYDLQSLTDNLTDVTVWAAVNGSCYTYSVAGATVGHEMHAVYQNYPVIILLGVNSDCFPTIQSAADAATQNSDRIQVQTGSYAEEVSFNQAGVTASLEGGYDSGFSASGGITTVYGSLTITDGTLTIQEITIQ